MEHKKFDKVILADIKKLYVYDNWHAVLALLYDYGMILFAICLAEYSYWFLPLSLLLIGSRQRALATILHEASHTALTKNKKFGKILGTYFSGYLIFQSWDSYRISHVKTHHPKLGTDIDPDYRYYHNVGVFNPCSRYDFFLKFLIAPMLCINVFKNIEYLFKHRLLSQINKKELVKMAVAQFFLL